MKTNKFGEMIFDEDDLCDQLMADKPVWDIKNITVDPTISLEKIISSLEDAGSIDTWITPENQNISVEEFDRVHQSRWFMPDEYKKMDIAEFVLGLCTTQEQLQRVGKELLMFQERNLFDLLRYLKYLVDVMRDNDVIWGVGRGSSVASYVLYLIGVHKVDSMYYDLDPGEFLR